MSEPAAENLEQQMRRQLAGAHAANEQYLSDLSDLAASSTRAGATGRSGLRADVAAGGGGEAGGGEAGGGAGPVPGADDFQEPAPSAGGAEAGGAEADGADGGGADVGGADASQPEQEPAMTVLTDTSLPREARVEVLRRLASSLSRRPEYLDVLLTIVADRDDDPQVRESALHVLGSAAFQVARFRPHQQRYEDVLRDLISDPVPALRETAVSTLAQAHDPVVQQLLADGLRGEGPLPVPREYAIQLLAEDDHLDNLPWLQEMYASDSADARQEAVRFMGSYPGAQETLENAMRDRNEASGVRQQSAASLRALAPQRFEEIAKEISTDSTEDAELRTSCLTALQHLGDTGGLYADTDFVDRVAQVGTDESSPGVAQVARDLVDRRPS